ncbi:HBL/NHE enterotoxin family protein [Bacillus thuringiensis]|nr:HBL/NHE enterotoxin family protein [Bacillus thuringiensis]
MTCAALAGALSVSSVGPSYVFAAETTASATEGGQKINLPDEYLGPDGLQKALQDTGSHTIVLDAYALTLLKSPQIKLEKDLFTEQKDKYLVDAIINSQNIAKEHATYWLNTLKPKLIDINQGIVNYGTKFDNYYETIVDAVNSNDKETTKKGIERLYNSVQENKKAVDQLVIDLQKFRNTLATDSTAFQDETNAMISSLEGKNAILPSLKQALDAYNSQVSSAIAMIASGGVLNLVGVGLGVLTVVLAVTGVGLPFATVSGIATAGAVGGGVALIVLGSQQLNSANEQIALTTAKMKNTELQAAALKSASAQTKSFSDTINIAIDSAQALSDQWSTMSSKYKSLLVNIDDISPNALAFIKEDLKTAKDSWLAIKKYADELYSKIDIKK